MDPSLRWGDVATRIPEGRRTCSRLTPVGGGVSQCAFRTAHPSSFQRKLEPILIFAGEIEDQNGPQPSLG
jgi:hypothetical protein